MLNPQICYIVSMSSYAAEYLISDFPPYPYENTATKNNKLSIQESRLSKRAKNIQQNFETFHSIHKGINIILTVCKYQFIVLKAPSKHRTQMVLWGNQRGGFNLTQSLKHDQENEHAINQTTSLAHYLSVTTSHNTCNAKTHKTTAPTNGCIGNFNMGRWLPCETVW